MKVTILFIVLLRSLVALAQPGKDFNPDYIIDRIYAIKQNDLYVEVRPGNGGYIYGQAADSPESLAKLYHSPKPVVITVGSLRKITAEAMLGELQHIQMNYPVHEGDGQKIVVNFLPGNLAMVSRISTNYDYVNTEFLTLEPEILSGRCILNIYKNGNLEGRLYPMKEGYKLRVFYEYGPDDPVVGSISDPEALTKRIHLNFPATEIFTQNNLYGVRLQEGKKTVMIPAVHDSIGFCNAAMVAVYTGRKPKLVYRNGDPALDGIRAFQPHSDHYTGILQGNETFYITDDGSRIDRIPQVNEECGTIPHYTDSIIKQGGYYKNYHVFKYGEKRLTEIVIAGASEFKDVKLLDGSRISYSDTGFYSQEDPEQKGYIVTLKSGAKSIIEINKDGTYKLSLEPDNYTFYAAGLRLPVRFAAGGLYGSWPQNSSARYRELSGFDTGFARFSLPDGTKGWLAYSGEEYIDE